MDLLSNRSEGNRRARPAFARCDPPRSTNTPAATDTAWMPTRTLSLATYAGAFLLTLFVVCSWTPAGEGNRFATALWIAVRDGGVALLWWVGAAGLGLWLVRTMLGARAMTAPESGPRTTVDELVLGIACGAALLLAAANALGSTGLLTAAGGIANWLFMAGGIFLLVRTLRDAPLVRDLGANDRWSRLVGPGAALALVALYAAAAASAPGGLWSSEFGGFDALSYHLELPKEWIMGGQPIGPVEGNVYSALPSFVEGAFMQVMLMRGSIVNGALGAQFWALFAAVATAAVVARLARCMVGEASGLIALLVFLSLPWALVVGTLAYNDIVPCLMFAAAWLVVEQHAREGRALDARGAALLALLAAAAVGAKPTAFLFVALPLLAIVVMRCGPRTLQLAPLVIAVALAALAPWLVRNQLAYGNALFPFAHALLGNGPWTDEQFAIFAKGHGPDRAFGDRLALLWSQWLAHGTGEPPAKDEPWFPQWGALPIAGLLGLGIAAIRDSAARAALVAIAIALVGWLLATHLKSRFLLPTAVPLTVGVAMLLALIARRSQPIAAPLLLAPALVLPFFVYWREPSRAVLVGATDFMTGERLARALADSPQEQHAELMKFARTEFIVNYRLPADAKVLAVGYSTPFYLARRVAWNTVWDRGVLDRVADASPGTPGVWGAKLRELGFTHVVINPTMLVVWTKSGWINPSLEPKRWLTAFLQANPSLQTQDKCFIVELQAPPAASQPGQEATPAPPADRPPSTS